METKKQKMKRLRKAFVQSCLNRDDHKCKLCLREQDLAVHHILPRKSMPNDGYSDLNGITLCPSCHIDAELVQNGLNAEYLFSLIYSSAKKAIDASEKL